MQEKRSRYWRKREEEAKKRYLEEESREYQKKLQEIYDRMQREIQREIEAFYGRYANKEGITIGEAKRRASQLDMEAYAKKAKQYVAQKNFSQKANEEMRLYNMTMKANRLELLKATIGLETVAGFDEMERYYSDKLHKRTLDEFARQAGILGMSIANKEKQARSIVNASFHNANFSQRIWMHQDLLRAELSKLLQTGLIQGRNPRVLARDLRRVFGSSKYDAERLLRTELARVQIDAQMDSYKTNGYEWFEFIGGQVGQCDICAALDGKVFRVKDMLVGENAPPVHPNCRCSTAASMGPDDSEQELEKVYKSW